MASAGELSWMTAPCLSSVYTRQNGKYIQLTHCSYSILWNVAADHQRLVLKIPLSFQTKLWLTEVNLGRKELVVQSRMAFDSVGSDRGGGEAAWIMHQQMQSDPKSSWPSSYNSDNNNWNNSMVSLLSYDTDRGCRCEEKLARTR